MRTFRHILVGCLSLLAGGILIFGPRDDTPLAKNRIIVSYWEKWTGREAEQMREIVDWFNNSVGAEKGIYVQYLSMSGIAQKTLISTAAGVPPDIAGLWSENVAPFAAEEALEPLDAMAANHGITEQYFKPVFWKNCQYRGKLYALNSTAWATALHYNKQIFLDHAFQLQKQGLDATRAPQTLQELDKYAQILDVFEGKGKARRLLSAGYLPMEPGWYITQTGDWFGAWPYDQPTGQLRLNQPRMLQALDWIQSYSLRLGSDTMGEFRSGLGQFNSTQNPFLAGTVAMVLQGPWMANYIEDLKPEMNRWRSGEPSAGGASLQARKDRCQWGVAPFPSAIPGLDNVSFCSADVLVIPRGAKHKKEAFEFIAFVNRQDVSEKLNSMHCTNSPLAKVSEDFLQNHPNPYIDVFEMLADSPNAVGLPEVGVWPQINNELSQAIQRIYLLRASPREALDYAQMRGQSFLDQFNKVQALRAVDRQERAQ